MSVQYTIIAVTTTVQDLVLLLKTKDPTLTAL